MHLHSIVLILYFILYTYETFLYNEYVSSIMLPTELQKQCHMYCDANSSDWLNSQTSLGYIESIEKQETVFLLFV